MSQLPLEVNRDHQQQNQQLENIPPKISGMQ